MAITTILGVFDTADAARTAMRELKDSNLRLHDTSLVAQDDRQASEQLNAPEGALLGAAWGGLVGLVALAIPGIGPFIAGGAVAAALTGAAAGAVVGGIGGALMHSNNLREADAKRYEGQVQAGKTLLVVKAEEGDALAVRRILAHDGANSIRENQSDILHKGAVQVDMYDEGGVQISSPYGEITDIEPVSNTPRVETLVSYQGSAVSEREASLKDADFASETPPTSGASGDSASFDTEDQTAANQPSQVGQTMENGARVVSYEEEDASKSKK